MCTLVRRIKVHHMRASAMADDVRLGVGLNVRRCRLAAGLTQASLAERMGVDRSYVSGLERGHRNPTVLTLWHLAEVLNVRVRDLVDGL
ncbi:helix-turn-helix transcriptional regulator [Terrihabitans rhizophilus]|uniref:Helix-turn-helix transcriptional regulator n=1 Tax=Terrihabitans rhizophilus TaxID=3092662 RepID=A0ABU4RMV3_9HYPH|nr:helix-turn-helix transcriptional regulator [Terrihabitans sp. PJ23]MDX6806147.1 helix-turn-helix transcriptional regulator [Terrihabitans sp. PJ23]